MTPASAGGEQRVLNGRSALPSLRPATPAQTQGWRGVSSVVVGRSYCGGRELLLWRGIGLNSSFSGKKVPNP